MLLSAETKRQARVPLGIRAEIQSCFCRFLLPSPSILCWILFTRQPVWENDDTTKTCGSPHSMWILLHCWQWILVILLVPNGSVGTSVHLSQLVDSLFRSAAARSLDAVSIVAEWFCRNYFISKQLVSRGKADRTSGLALSDCAQTAGRGRHPQATAQSGRETRSSPRLSERQAVTAESCWIIQENASDSGADPERRWRGGSSLRREKEASLTWFLIKRWEQQSFIGVCEAVRSFSVVCNRALGAQYLSVLGCLWSKGNT